MKDPINLHTESQFDVPTTRYAEVYAWVPKATAATPINETTQSAQYGIWTATGWRQIMIDQSEYQNQWVLLGVFEFHPDSVNNYVILNANTGEAPGTNWVMADGLKFRTYHIFIPLTQKYYY